MIKHRFFQLKSLVTGMLRSPFYSSKYEIKKGYFHREEYTHFSDIGARFEGQKEVYETALRIAKDNNLKSVVDIGCGSGYKLINLFSNDYDTTGIEILDTYTYLKNNYKDHNWLNGEKLNYDEISADLIICSDVIEHVVDPDILLKNIKKIKGTKFICISTPERLLARGWFDYGPPRNWTHTREWTGKEFRKYISNHFSIISHQITNFNEKTQLIVCKTNDK